MRFRPSIKTVVFIAAAVVGALVGFLPGIFNDYDYALYQAGGECPTAKAVESRLSASLIPTERFGEKPPVLEVRLTGVEPARSDWGDLDLSTGAHAFADCFVPVPAYVTSVEWRDGTLATTLNLYPTTTSASADTDRSEVDTPVLAKLGLRESTLSVLLCNPELELNTALACQPSARNTIEFLLANSAKHASPFPAQVKQEGDKVAYSWVFSGAPPEVSATVTVPFVEAATQYLQSVDTGTLSVAAASDTVVARFDLGYVAYGLSAFAALLTGALLLPRNAGRPRLVGIVLGALIVGAVQVDFYDLFSYAIPGAVVAAIGWFIILVSLPLTRMTTAIAVLSPFAMLAILWMANEASAGSTSTSYQNAAGALSVVVLSTLLLSSAATLFKLVMSIFDVRDDDKSTDRQFRNTITAIAIFGIVCAIGVPVGRAFTYSETELSMLDALLTELSGASFNAGLAVAELARLIVVAFLAAHVLEQQKASPATWNATPAIVALMVTLAVPWSQSGAQQIIVSVPMWLLQFAIMWLVMRVWIPRETPVGSVDRPGLLAAMRGPPMKQAVPASILLAQEADEMSSAADQGESTTAASGEGTAQPTGTAAGYLLLQFGAKHTATDNARKAATLAGYLAIIPVLYFIWTTLAELTVQLSWSTGALLLVIAVITEAVRWVVGGFVFGYLYPKIPGRIGPVKALVFAGVWALSSLGPTALARGFALNVTQEFIYRSAQFALFVIILAVLIDISTLKAAGGSWRDLRQVYALQNYGDVVAAVAPAALLTITLAQQIVAGSGFDVAQSFLSGLPNLLR